MARIPCLANITLVCILVTLVTTTSSIHAGAFVGQAASDPAPACGYWFAADDILIALGDDEAAEQMVARLRRLGPWALAEMKELFDKEELDPSVPEQAERLERWHRLFDRVAQQRYARWSQLYWYTDLDRAKQVAEHTEKPILSLHLLGDLTEERTCANSRLFRTILYADTTTATYLRENFILHWWSSMDIPEVTIDYGDGRVLKSTVTGNSLHYVLAADGSVLDAIPGLWTPTAFRERLAQSVALAQQAGAWTGDERASELAAWRQKHFNVQVGNEFPLIGEHLAVHAELLSVSKVAMPTEMPVVRAMGLQPSDEALSRDRIRNRQRWADWELASFLGVDPNSHALISWQVRGMMDRMAESTGDMLTEERRTQVLGDLIAAMCERAAADTALNRHELSPQVLRLLNDMGGADLDAVNKRIYAEVFKTPHDDPWMGLAPHTAYTALSDGGLIVEDRGVAKNGD